MPLTGQFAHEQANRLLSELSRQIARAIRSASADQVHDLRVAIRRFKSVLTVLEPCFAQSEAMKIRRSLKSMMGQAGNVRDRDIALTLLSDIDSREAEPLMDRFRKERDGAAGALGTSLRGWVRRKSAAAWRKALRGEPPDAPFCARPIGDTAKDMLPRMAKDHFQQGEDAAREKSCAKELHRFRIATKKFRYTLDLFEPLYPSLQEFAGTLKDIQTLLGEGNDYAVVRRMVPRHEGAGEVREALKRKQRKRAGQFRKKWPEKSGHGPKNLIP